MIEACPARVIQELAGHASIMTTERYMHLAPGSTRDAVKRLERFDGFGSSLAEAPAALKTAGAPGL